MVVPRFQDDIPGNHVPKCDGYCLSAGSECGCEGDMTCFSFTLTLLPTVAWALCVAPSLGWACACVGCSMLVLSTYYLVKAHYMDPGLLPTQEVTGGIVEGERSHRPKVQVISGGKAHELVEFRAKMCSETANCVENFDHFCPWVGNAVGARNYKSFFLFVCFANLLAAFVGVSSVYHLFFVYKTDTAHAFLKEAQLLVSIVLVGYCAIILCTVGGLLFYHISLISGNTTTNEDIKIYNGVHHNNPNNIGCCGNWKRFMLTSPRESYFSKGRRTGAPSSEARDTEDPPPTPPRDGGDSGGDLWPQDMLGASNKLEKTQTPLRSTAINP